MTIIIVSLLVLTFCHSQTLSEIVRANRNSPQLEKPILLNLYLPAAMQIIAHLTDLMKYDVKPATPSTTTPRPTSPHRPGIFAPPTPPGVNFPKELLQGIEGRENEDEKSYVIGELPEDLDLFGVVPSELLNRINFADDYDFEDDDQRVLKFTYNYDDFNVKQYVIGNKKSPPTRAYVTLLSLYDQLNGQAKKLKLNKYNGYTDEILKFLEESSTGTSAAQLRTVLQKMVDNKEFDNGKVRDKTNTMINDLNTSNSYINQALRYVPPLRFEN